jgi:hypothetical protein
MSVVQNVSMCCLIVCFHDLREEGGVFPHQTVGLAKWHVFFVTVLVLPSMFMYLHSWKLLPCTEFLFVPTCVTFSLYVGYYGVLDAFENSSKLLCVYVAFVYVFVFPVSLTSQLWQWQLGLHEYHDIPYILESNPHLNLICASFCWFLKQKMLVRVLIRTFPSTAPCLQGRLIE